MASKFLQDIITLDLAHVLSNPFATMTLADLGAETIKVAPLKGEDTRELLKKNKLYWAGGIRCLLVSDPIKIKRL